MGNNTAQTFISTGVFGNGFAVLSDKRVYFKGKCLIRKGKGFYRKIEEKSVDVKDITGTGFVHNKATWAKILFIVFLALAGWMGFMSLMGAFFGVINTAESVKAENFEMAAGIIPSVFFFIAIAFIFRFLYNRYNYSAFEISYAGGGIAFDMHWINETESHEFQKQLNLLKDKIKTEPPETPPHNNLPNIPEQLKQYKELFDNGIITQEEFNEKKKQLLKL